MAFLGLKVPHEVGRLFREIEIPGDKVAESDYHVTILCFDDEWPISEIAKAMEATFDVLNKFEPFHMETSVVTCFPKREDNPVPIIAKMKSKELMKLSDALRKEFDKQKIEYSKIFKDFKPHMTLSYAEDEIKDRKISPIEFFVHEIVLWGGDNGDDRIFITFPLAHDKPKRGTFLQQYASLFLKLSEAPPNATFKPSKERRLIKR